MGGSSRNRERAWEKVKGGGGRGKWIRNSAHEAAWEITARTILRLRENEQFLKFQEASWRARNVRHAYLDPFEVRMNCFKDRKKRELEEKERVERERQENSLKERKERAKQKEILELEEFQLRLKEKEIELREREARLKVDLPSASGGGRRRRRRRECSCNK